MDFAMRISGDDDGLVAHPSGDEITRPEDLALVRKKEPASGEDSLQLEPIDLFVGEKAATHEPSVSVHQALEVYPHRLPLPELFDLPLM